MDPLSDVLRAVRLSGAHFFQAVATGDWAVEAPPARDLSSRVLPGSEHLIPYHVILAGRCWGGVKGQPLVALEAGDVILFPHGSAHLMSNRPEVRSAPMVVPRVPRFPADARYGTAEVPDARLVCGFFGCDLAPFNPLCSALPAQLHLRGLQDGLVGTFARQVVEETRAGRAGAESMLTRLAELMFIEVLRRHLEALPADQGGWLAGIRDPLVGRALALLHERPAHHWTLAELATAAHASRSNLAERFSQLVGIPPIQYLAEWRMQLAAGLLRDSGAKVAAVAADVGYESEAAFSRAFKKVAGCRPSEWRQRGARPALGNSDGVALC
jgi:AraC-like DNA-binding protein